MSSAHPPTEICFPSADVRLSAKMSRSKMLKSVRVFVSTRVYWKEFGNSEQDGPQSFLDFIDADCIDIARMHRASTWDEVEELVKPGECNNNPCVTLSGVLHGPTRRKRLFRNPNVTIDLVAESREQRDVWLDQIRACITPWNLLQQRIKELASFMHSIEVENLKKNFDMLRVLATHRHSSGIVSVPSSSSQSETKRKWLKKLSILPQKFQKLDWMEGLNAQGAAAVETGKSFVGLVCKAEQVANTAEFVADVSKCVAGCSTVFQLLVLGARAVRRFAEAERGRHVLPYALEKITTMLGYVLQSLGEILCPPSKVEPIQVDFVFGVLMKTVNTIKVIETQLLRGWVSRFLHAKIVMEVEMTMDELEHKVVTSVHSSKLKRLESETQIIGNYEHHVRPELSPFFAGRTKEIEKLTDALNSYGSAVITQFGGVGKTELMVAVAERMEKEHKVPGGLFWISVDGDKSNVVETLARLVEKFTGRIISDSDRKNRNIVVAALKRALSKREGRWLLCLDNADDPEIEDILDAICALAEPNKKNGWVLVTSRRGDSKTWRRMKSNQKLALQSLPVEDAMILLWRQVHVIMEKEKRDTSVLVDINKLKSNTPSEYKALKELCGYNSAYSLGGLPLAIVQAGTFIGRFECSFEEYLKLLRRADNKKKLANLLEKSNELTLLSDSQRSVLTTWTISVERLSKEAYDVLRTLSMVGVEPIPDLLVSEILKQNGDGNESVEEKLRNIVMKELVHGSSLVYRKETEEGQMFIMHRLVKRFVLTEVERSKGMWKKIFSVVLVALHGRVGEMLEGEGKSFGNFPEMYGSHHRVYVMHTIAFVEQLSNRSSLSDCTEIIRLMFDISRYAGDALDFFGMVNEAEDVWWCSLSIVQKYTDWEKEKSKEQETIAFLYSELGKAMGKTGRCNESISMLSNSLAMYRDIFGKNANHAKIALALSNLGTSYRRKGMLDDAKRMYTQSLVMKRSVYGKDAVHADIASSLNCLGNVYEDQKKLDDAESMYEQSLKMRRTIHGKDAVNVNIAASLNNLGNIYELRGKLNDAESMYEQSLSMERAIYGEDAIHSDIASSLNNLGCVYLSQSKLDEAESMHKQSLEMRRVIHGEDAVHADIALSLNNLGNVYDLQEKWVDAETMYEQSLTMRRAIYGENAVHIHIAASLSNLGKIYELLGKLHDAESMYEKCLIMERAVHGEDAVHLDIAQTLNNLGNIYELREKFADAEKMHEQCLTVYRAIHGEDTPHHDIAISLYNMALVYKAQEKLRDAETVQLECLETYRGIYGAETNHSNILDSLKLLGEIYEQQGKHDEAQRAYEEVRELTSP